MPVRENSVRRQDKLKSLLLGSAVPLTVSKLANELGVTVRTVHRDLKALRSRGVNYVSSKRPGLGIQLATGTATEIPETPIAGHYRNLIDGFDSKEQELLRWLALADEGWRLEDLRYLVGNDPVREVEQLLERPLDTGIVTLRKGAFAPSGG